MAETVTSITRPAPFIEAAGQTYLEGLQSAIGDAQGQDLTQLFGPQFVAKPGAFTQQAQSLAGGLGSFAPFLQTAAAGTGPQAYQQFMSPFQKDVIDATLKEFDTQAAKGLPALAAQAINAGAFGGGREGVQRAEYQQASDRNRAALQSQLLQSGFGQAQQLAQQNFQNQMGLAQLSPSLVGQQISALGALGTQQQAQQQAQLSAQQQLLQQQANRPLDLAQQLGQGVTSLISGYPAQFTTQTQPTPSPLQTALGAGATLAGVYRAFS
jgi:hypothetical protein